MQFQSSNAAKRGREIYMYKLQVKAECPMCAVRAAGLKGYIREIIPENLINSANSAYWASLLCVCVFISDKCSRSSRFYNGVARGPQSLPDNARKYTEKHYRRACRCNPYNVCFTQRGIIECARRHSNESTEEYYYGDYSLFCMDILRTLCRRNCLDSTYEDDIIDTRSKIYFQLHETFSYILKGIQCVCSALIKGLFRIHYILRKNLDYIISSGKAEYLN